MPNLVKIPPLVSVSTQYTQKRIFITDDTIMFGLHAIAMIY